jgi:hypothetical protein
VRKLLSLLRIVYNLALNLVLLVRHRVGKLGRNGSLKISDRATPNSHGTIMRRKEQSTDPQLIAFSAVAAHEPHYDDC